MRTATLRSLAICSALAISSPKPASVHLPLGEGIVYAQPRGPRTPALPQDVLASTIAVNREADTIFAAASDNAGRLRAMHSRNRIGGTQRMTGNANITTNTPDQSLALRQIDCTNGTILFLALVRAMNERHDAGIDAHALIIRRAGASVDHGIVVARDGSQTVNIDPTSSVFGQIGDGQNTYTRVLEYPDLTSSAALFYRQIGIRLTPSRRTDAIAAFERADELFNRDAAVLEGLGDLYFDRGRGDLARSFTYHARGHAIDPTRYSAEKWNTINANEEYRLGTESFGRREFAACREHFAAAGRHLRAAGDTTSDMVASANTNQAACERNDRITSRDAGR
ncbi:hypothetical protein HY990_06320 [Candidatus Micrarchaeota archaeon]|nr:hypothetical protein [Candidatus Micrarchaeota archaeon]